jgi:hypothetical protein
VIPPQPFPQLKVNVLERLKALDRTLREAEGHLVLLSGLPENSRLELQSNLVAAEARVRHMIVLAEIDERHAAPPPPAAAGA